MLYLFIRLSNYLRFMRSRGSYEAGQASAEYALVLLGAAAIALLVGAWAVKTDLVGDLLDTVLGAITKDAKDSKRSG